MSLKAPSTVLQSFITAITEEKELTFGMASWFKTDDSIEDTPVNVKNVCGTSACIAGTVAFRLAPKSTESCTAIILGDIGVRIDSEWSGEEQVVDCVLEAIFTSAALYGVEEGWLDLVTQDMVLKVLRKLVEANHNTWISLAEEVNRIVRE